MKNKSQLEIDLSKAGLSEAEVKAIMDRLNDNADQFAHELHARLFARLPKEK
jgi:hypothetical protein